MKHGERRRLEVQYENGLAGWGWTLAVPDRKHGSREAVGRDDAEVPDGRGTVKNIDHQPSVANHTPEYPTSQTLVGGRQRQYGNGDRHQ